MYRVIHICHAKFTSNIVWHTYFAKYNINSHFIGVCRQVKEMVKLTDVKEPEWPVDRILNGLVNGSTTEMLAAARSFGEQGEKAVDTVMPVFRNSDRVVRWRVAIALERIGTPAVAPLIQSLKEDKPYVKIPAIWALENIGDERAIDPLIEVMNGSDECCRLMAAAALKKFGTQKSLEAVNEAFRNDDGTQIAIVDELVEGS
jgi:HEAT repeat protein